MEAITNNKTQKKIKNKGTLELTQTIGKHEPIVTKEEYDKVLEIAPDGKGDYHNLYTVLNRCNRNLKTAERNFNTEIKTFGMANPNPVAEPKPKFEENQIDEPEMTNEM